MIIWGHSNRERSEDSGRFWCPRCNHDCSFILIRTWKYFHLYFIPLAKQELMAERIQCGNCNGSFPVTVLAGAAAEVPSMFEAGDASARSIADNFGNVLELADSAIDEIRKRHEHGRFDADVAVRVTPDRLEHCKVTIAFDLPLLDGRDWIGQSRGIPIVVDRDVAPELLGCTIEFRDGDFVRR